MSATPSPSTTATPRVRRKPVPKFEYSARYPAPDPSDPLAPLSVLRSRHTDPASPIYPVSPPSSSELSHNIASFVREWQQNVAEPPSNESQWRRYTVDVRKPSNLPDIPSASVTTIDSLPSALMRDLPTPGPLQRQETVDLLEVSPSAQKRAEKRKRAKSVAVVPSRSAQSLRELPPLPAKPSRRTVTAPSSAPSSTSASPQRRPVLLAQPSPSVSSEGHGSSRSSRDISSQLADFSDYPLHLLHTLGRDSFVAESVSDDRRATIYKPMRVLDVDMPEPHIAPEAYANRNSMSEEPQTAVFKTMRVMDVDMPAPHMTREASTLSSMPFYSPEPVLLSDSQGSQDPRSVARKSSRMSLFSRVLSRPSTPAPGLSTSSRPSSSSDGSESSGYATAASVVTPLSSALSGAVSPSSNSSESAVRQRNLKHNTSAVDVDALSEPESSKKAKERSVRSRSRSMSVVGKGNHRKSSSQPSLKAMISLPVTAPVPIPLTATPAALVQARAMVDPEFQCGVAAASKPEKVHSSPHVQPLVSSRPQAPREATRRNPSPLRSPLDSNSPTPATPSAGPDVGTPPSPAVHAPAPTPDAATAPLPPDKDLAAMYKPKARSPPLPPREPSAERPPPPALPKLAPLTAPIMHRAPRTAGPIMPSRTFPISRCRSGSLRDPASPTSPIVGRRRPAARSQTALSTFVQPKHEHGVVGLGALPNVAQLAKASQMIVLRETGLPVPFGELWKTRRTVVLFIRHFWCPSCQDYLTSLMREVDHAALQASGVQMVVIGCGPFSLIKSYRHIFRLPYQLFVDPSPDQQLYSTLGMSSVLPSSARNRPSGNGTKDSGDYVRHGPVRGHVMVWKNALRAGMPIWAKGGDSSQLGGEFVLGPGLTCTYAHRMQHTRGHAPVLEVLMAAGVDAARTARIRFSSHKSTDSEGSSSSDIEHLPARNRRAVKTRKSTLLRRDSAMFVRTLSCHSVGWDSNTSNETGIIVRSP